MPSSLLTRRFPRLALAALLAACGGDETAPEQGHTPASARVFLDGIEVTDALLLPTGETVRLEIRFYHDDGEQVTGIDDHFSSLTFTPAALATVAAVDGQPFQKDVTTGAVPGTGSYTVGYGHDEAADELTFGPFDASVVVSAGGNLNGRYGR